uniref:MULE transposase domain-containing protein n=1 Tax=Lactuca sativa TaxID=4236 RepID=A0A9R1V550_LACSA|nr:hypothetical protein LSAT_V11C600341710 [Lactuca sativa]
MKKLHNKGINHLVEESYHSHYSFDNEYELLNFDFKIDACSNKSQVMKVHSKFPNKLILVLEAISVITNMQLKDGLVMFVTNKHKSDGDVSPANLKKWLMQNYNVDVPYMRVFRGREQAYSDMYGKWDDSYGSFNGVLAVATSIDGNNDMFLVAYDVLEFENTKSWTWFLKSLKKAIGTPNGLVISSDMHKGLEVSITHVYPNVKHHEYISHLYRNFKKHFKGDYFRTRLWGATKTYFVSKHDRMFNKIASVCKDVIIYFNENHDKIWSRSKFGTLVKCDYITNNISETFNSWVGDIHYKLVLDLLAAIREKLMQPFNKKRKIVNKWKGTLNLGNFEVCRSSDNRAQVNYKGKSWEVILDEKIYRCRVWQVKGLPCVHATVFIAFTRESDWDKYVDTYFTIHKFKEAYALEVAPMSGKDQWGHIETIEKIYSPIIKRPPGRPKKNKIIPHDEPKKRHRCPRCGMFGHHEKTCKNPASQGFDDASTNKMKEHKKNNEFLLRV